MNTEWIYQGNPITEIESSFVGFIYVITHIDTGKRYFGKKQAKFKKTSLKVVTLKSGVRKKKKIRTMISSDWETYYGSSNELLKDIELFGKDEFSREILVFCNSLSDMSYQEAKIQFSTDALLHPDKFYNSWISVRVRRDHLIKK